jgi:hypothetical protein
VLVQNPSLVLALLVSGPVRWLFRFRVIVDAHNEAVMPFVNRQWAIVRAARFVLRHADLTIVSNDELGRLVRDAGGRPFTLPDPMPEVPAEALDAHPPRAGCSGCGHLGLCAGRATERILGAAREVGEFPLPRERQFSFRPGSVIRCLQMCAHGVPARDGLLAAAAELAPRARSHHANAVCGSYEALAAGRPMLLTADPAARQLFSSSALYTQNEPRAIAQALRQARADYEVMCASAPSRREEFTKSWAARRVDLQERIRSLVAAA